MAAVVSRRNVFIRLFGLLVVASLFTSYLIYLQVNADDQIVRITRRERSRKDSNIAIISKLYTPVRRSVMIRKSGRHDHRQHSEEAGNVGARAHVKKSRLSVLRETFGRNKRARRTVGSITSLLAAEIEPRRTAQQQGASNMAALIDMKKSAEKSSLSAIGDQIKGDQFRDQIKGDQIKGDQFRDNIRSAHRTVNSKQLDARSVTTVANVKKSESIEHDKSFVIDDSFRHNSSAHRTVDKQLEARSMAAMADVEKPESNRYDKSPVIGDTIKTADVKKPNSTPHYNSSISKHLEATSVTAIAHVKEQGSRSHDNSPVIGDTFRANTTSAHTTVKATSVTAIRDVRKPLTLRGNPSDTDRTRTIIKQILEQVINKTSSGDMNASRTNVIIVAQPRTGSSFLGDAFNQHPGVFYLFEPLYGVSNHPLQHLNDPKPMQFLAGSLRCKFVFPQYVKEIEQFRRFSSNALTSPPLCTTATYPPYSRAPKKKCVALTTKNMEAVCKSNYSLTVMKILTSRIPNNKVESLFPLCNSSNCTIIYLVRDPRPVIFSHLKVGIKLWQSFKIRANNNAPRPSLRFYSAQICRKIEANVRTFQNLTGWMKSRYHMLRYEDLARNPTGTLRRVYKMAGLSMVNTTLQWIKLHTGEGRSSVVDEKNNYSTNRNSKTLVDKWRLEVDPCLVNIIEDSCRSVMKLLGYKLLNRSEKMQYNLNVSLSDGL